MIGEEQTIEIVPKNITLYWMSGQIDSWKIRIALEEKQLQGYKSIMIIQSDNIDKNDKFWKNNEDGIIPSLRIENIALNGVLPALLFLETSMPTFSSDSSSEDKALILERAFESLTFQRICSEDLITNIFSLNDFNTSFFDIDQRNKHEKALYDELIRWNEYLAQNSHDSIAHSSFNLADMLFFPELALGIRFGLPIHDFSHLQNYYEIHSKRQSIYKTWPYHWLHTTLTYDWLGNITRFNQKSLEDTSIIQDTSDKINSFVESSEETKSVDD